MSHLQRITEYWSNRLAQDYAHHPEQVRSIILWWLLQDQTEAIDDWLPQKLEIWERSVIYRYGILQRYLNDRPSCIYNTLVIRLASLASLRSRIIRGVSQSRDRSCTIQQTLMDVIQMMLQRDRHLQNESRRLMTRIQSRYLQNCFLCATIEEYCRRSVNKRPLIYHRLNDYFISLNRGGITHIPSHQKIQLISDTNCTEPAESKPGWLEKKAVEHYNHTETTDYQLTCRAQVQQALEIYLAESLGPDSVAWLKLHLQNYSPEEIAQSLDWPIQQVYRLREKVSYHAMNIFAPKVNPLLVGQWLQISLDDDNFGLTPSQWRRYWQSLTPQHQQFVLDLKSGKTLATIAASQGLRNSQIMARWRKVYKQAQKFRQDTPHPSPPPTP